MYWVNRNLGDELSPVMIAALLDAEPYIVDRTAEGKVLGIGSILAHVRPRDLVFGTGAIRDERIDGKGASFFAVRGPLTRALIDDADVPEVYGDPALLLASIYEPVTQHHQFSIGLVPHYVDQDVMRSVDPAVVVVDVRHPDWRRSIDSICACDIIVSSSLHGIILAEAYGIPAVWVKPSDRVIGEGFKFHDYYASTQRSAHSVSWKGDTTGLSKVVSRAVAPPQFDQAPMLEAANRMRAELFGT